jgi:ATP-binding cassette subfamily B protein
MIILNRLFQKILLCSASTNPHFFKAQPLNPISSWSELLPRWQRLLQFIAPFQTSVVGILALSLGAAGINALEPLVLKSIFDTLTSDRQEWQLVVSVVTLLLLSLVREGGSATANWLTWRTRLGFQYLLLEATIGKLQRLPLELQRREGVGTLLTKLDRSIQSLSGAVNDILFNALPSAMFLVVSLIVMVRLEWRLALMVFCFAPLPAVIAARAAPAQIVREKVLLEKWAHLYGRLTEVLSGIVTVRSFVMEDVEQARFLRGVKAANRVVLRGVQVDTSYGAAANLVVAIARIVVTAYGGLLVLQGAISLGTVIAFLGYVGGLFGPVQGLSGLYQTLRRASVSLAEVFSILDVQEHLPDAPTAQQVRAVQGAVVFERVQFAYEPRQQPVIQMFDLVVQPGEMIALVGPSGGGKTTLMSLLQRFYDPLAGCIRLDGQDLRLLKQRSLRQHIGIVLQHPLLFNDTVRNNIAYGRPKATLAEIEMAAQAANAHEFIVQLPAAYDTILGEQGSRLSMGERQRLTIARALLKNPPILILDEATSSLDAESEALVLKALKRLMQGRTTFMIAHRLATVAHADRIVVLKDGRIVEMGNHKELMDRKGYYASLVRLQTGGLFPSLSTLTEEDQNIKD